MLSMLIYLNRNVKLLGYYLVLMAFFVFCYFHNFLSSQEYGNMLGYKIQNSLK